MNPNLRVVGLTATPYRMKGGLICKPGTILNRICYEKGIKEMIVDGYLSRVRTIGGAAKADLERVGLRAGEFIPSAVEAVMDQESRYLRALSATRSLRWEREKDLLSFLDEDAQPVLRFSRMDAKGRAAE